MPRITENLIELLAIQHLESLGYHHLYGPDIAPDVSTSSATGAIPDDIRDSFEQVLLLNRLKTAVGKINSVIPADAQTEAIKEIQRIASPELLANNETFHRLLTEGIPVTKRIQGDDRGDRVWLIDFINPTNNEFLVVNQFTIVENHQNKRPDILLFVNGIPLVVIELKNAADEKANVHSAFRQIETYKAIIPSLFTYNGFNIISDGLEAKAGSLSAGFSRYMAWKTADGKTEASHLVGQLETLIQGMLNKETLLDLIRHFIVFEKSKKVEPLVKSRDEGPGKDSETGITTISTVKKIAAYHQYYAVNRAVESTMRATGIASTSSAAVAPLPEPVEGNMVNESPESYGMPGVRKQPVGDRKGGVVWHTQGSGKSLSMVFYTGKIVLALDNPTILVITDRNDLDDQLFDTFAA